MAYLDGSRLKRVFSLAGTTSPDGEERIAAVSWSPDGRRLLCLCAKGLYVIGADGSGGHRLSLPGRGQLGPATWSPDGKRVAFESHCLPFRQGSHDFFCDVGFVNPDGSGVRTATRSRVASISDAPRWSADGNVLVDGPPGMLHVIAIDPRTNRERVLYKQPAWNLTLGPGGVFALLTSTSGQQSTLVIADRSGRSLTRRALPIDVTADAAIHIG